MQYMFLVEVILLILIAIATGRGTQKLAKFLDLTMDYGNIFWEFRYWIMSWKAPKKFKEEFDDLIEHQAEEASRLGVSDERNIQEKVGDLYARYTDMKIKKWVQCPVCFGFWLFMPISWVVFFFMGMPFEPYYGIFILGMFIGFIEF